MAVPHISCQFIDLECTEDSQLYRDMKVGVDGKSGAEFFDATDMIEKKNVEGLSVDHFLYVCSIFFKHVVEYNNITPEETIRENGRKHILMNTCLAYLFISYVEPGFIGFIFDKFAEIVENGISYSPYYIEELVRNTFSKEEILQIASKIEDGEGAGGN